MRSTTLVGLCLPVLDQDFASNINSRTAPVRRTRHARVAMNLLRALVIAATGLIVSCVQAPPAPPGSPPAAPAPRVAQPQAVPPAPAAAPSELAAPHVPVATSAPVPLTQEGKPVAWWFVCCG